MNARANATSGGHVTVRYWAAARAAAGVESDVLAVEGSTTLEDVLRRVRALHDASFDRVVGACAALVDDQPAGGGDPARVRVEQGQTVELLPPFAGG